MQFFGSLIFLTSCLIGGFVMSGGHVANLWQPYEILMLLGSGVGFFLASNSMHGVKMFFQFFGYIFKKPYSADKFQQQIGMMTKLHAEYNRGKKDISAHIEDPDSSEIFKAYPKVLADTAGKQFLCNNLTLLVDEGNNLTVYDFEDMMEAEIEQYEKEWHSPYKGASALVDTFPAIGIAVAVLGIVVSMQFLDAGMIVLGEHVGAALFGTFLGIFMAYCVFKPLSLVFSKFADESGLYLRVIKTYLICMRKEYNPVKSATVTNKDVPPRYKLDTNILRDKVMSGEL
ncbi:motility-associated protein [Photobacterium damselae]|uniref:motility-associated protein n=1 Tax=Photobacterium damselae TaxID=38293 RepID=UPI004067F066